MLYPPFTERAYYSPSPDDADWRFTFTEAQTGFGAVLLTTPIFQFKDRQVVNIFVPVHLDTVVMSTTADTLPIGYTPPHWFGRFELRGTTEVVRSPIDPGYYAYQGMLFVNQLQDRKPYGDLTYQLYRSGNLISQATLENQILLPALGPYTLTIPFDQYSVWDRAGQARATVGFDAANPIDPNPPYLLTLNGLTGNRILDTLSSGGSEIRFVAKDDVAVSQTTLSYKITDTWQTLPVDRWGDTYSAPISELPDGAYVALRLEARDAQGNWLRYEADPAFYTITPVMRPLYLPLILRD
jgi:hypothetical protein